MSQAKRAYIYRVIVALGAVLVGAGVLAEHLTGDLLTLAGAVLALGGDGLAVVNTPRKTPLAPPTNKV